MFRVASLLAALAVSSASATYIPNTDCFATVIHGDKSFPFTVETPQVTGGMTQQTCDKQFSSCSSFQDVNNNPAGAGFDCQEVYRYTIQAPTASPTGAPTDAGVICPDLPAGTPQECMCQEQNSLGLSCKAYFNFTFSLSYSDCCCFCTGDPHCRSFTGQTDTWVVCNGARDVDTCAIVSAKCNAAQYYQDGNMYNCKFIGKTSNGACIPAGPMPWMNMYSKIDNDVPFQVDLGLGSLGNIVVVRVTVGGAVTSLSFDTPSAQAAVIMAKWAKGLSNGVHIFVEAAGAGTIHERYTVNIWDSKLGTAVNPDGFCQVGTISEGVAPPQPPKDSGCVPTDLFVYQRLYKQSRGTQAQAIAAKNQFCASKFDGADTQTCKNTPWYMTLCVIISQVTYADIQDPNNVPAEYSDCIERIQDYPGEMFALYQGVGTFANQTVAVDCTLPQNKVTGNAPFGQFVAAGMYAYLQYQTGANTWSNVFALSENQAYCKPKFSITKSNNAPLWTKMTQYGTYRVLQCQPPTQKCSTYNVFTASSEFHGDCGDELDQKQYSSPLGGLFAGNYLACTVPNCPTALPEGSENFYRCCQWPVGSTFWSQCMADNGQGGYDADYFAANYPNCTQPVASRR